MPLHSILDEARPLRNRYRHSGASSFHGLERAPKIRLASRGIKKDRTQKPDRIPLNSSTALALRATKEKIAGTVRDSEASGHTIGPIIGRKRVSRGEGRLDRSDLG